MKLKTISIGVLVGLGMHIACAGEPDPRFYGVWVGVETYHIWAHGGPGGQWGQAPVKKSAVLAISDGGKTLDFGQGRVLVRDKVSAWWGKNSLDWRAYLAFSGRDHGKLVLSADGNTLTETAVAILPGRPGPVTCNITGTLHREEKK